MEAVALQMKDVLTITHMHTLKYLLRSARRLLGTKTRPIEWLLHRLHTFPYDSAQSNGWDAVCVCVLGVKSAEAKLLVAPRHALCQHF